MGARAAARTTQQQGWSGSTSSPLLFLAGGEDHRHLQPKENAQAVGFSYFLDLFSSAFHPCLLHFLLSQVCSWGFAVFSSASGTWAAAGGDLDRSAIAAGRRCWLKKAGSSGR
jgi:hypothetical protein